MFVILVTDLSDAADSWVVRHASGAS